MKPSYSSLNFSFDFLKNQNQMIEGIKMCDKKPSESDNELVESCLIILCKYVIHKKTKE